MNLQQTPSKDKTAGSIPMATLNVSPVKIPNGAKHVGNYILGKTIGNGTYGKVHLGLHIQSGEKVAIKIIEKQKLNGKDLQRIQRQINILKQICHSSIIQLHEIIETQKSLLLVTEFMPNGELFNYIVQNKKLNEKEACSIFHQIINGLEYLHNMGIAHRDIKPENMMIGFDKKIKIIDFGLANNYQPEKGLKTECGSPCYAAPEMISGKPHYDPLKTDIWSCGVTLFAMIAGYLPFCDKQTPKLFKKIVTGSFTFPDWVSNSVRQLLSSILTVNPHKRFNLQDIKNHQWFCQLQYIHNLGIDTRFFKVPYQKYVIQHMIQQKLGTIGLSEKIEKNQKNKETTIYYLIIKKFVSQGIPVSSYYDSKYFMPQLAKPLIEDDNCSSTQPCVQVQLVSPITQIDGDIPKPGYLPSFSLKSPSFKPILMEFLSPQPDGRREQKKITQKQHFYGFNSDNWKKRTKLTAKTSKQRAENLFNIRKKSEMNKSLLKPIKKQKRKNAIELLQSLNCQYMSKTLPNNRRTLSVRKHDKAINMFLDDKLPKI